MECRNNSECENQATSTLIRVILIASGATPLLSLAIFLFCYGFRIPCRLQELFSKSESHSDSDEQPPVSPRVFQLSELRDDGLNEIGQGSFGFVYKLSLPDGSEVAVKRAAATILNSDGTLASETQLTALCRARHPNLVNMLGYCFESGEKMLVYEYMPRGSLNYHLHVGGAHVNSSWRLRIEIAKQAAKGLYYLHRRTEPPIFHGNVKSANILLDEEWGAKIADFGLISSHNRDHSLEIKSDVYNFGIVLLEILSGRKAYDPDCTPPNIVDWAVPLITRPCGGAGIIMHNERLRVPRNLIWLLKLADMAKLAVAENPNDRPPMSRITALLVKIVKYF